MLLPTKLLASAVGLALLTLSPSVSAQCALPKTYSWTATPDAPLATPKEGWLSLKDMTHVPYDGQHLVYATNHNGKAFGSMSFGLFSNWSDMATASQSSTPFTAVAPSLFLFRPKNIWVMAYQWGSATFTYRTATDPTDVNGWSAEKPLFTGKIANAEFGPIDQAVIGDDENMYLFFAGDNGRIYRTSMPIDNFPGNFGSESTIILHDTKEKLYEAVQVYSVKGQNQYLMIVEAVAPGDVRYFRSFTATSLNGTWTPQGTDEKDPFAGKANTDITWSNDVSHGDLIRSDPDEKMTIDVCNLQLLFQGQAPHNGTAYDKQLYRPGLLSLDV